MLLPRELWAGVIGGPGPVMQMMGAGNLTTYNPTYNQMMSDSCNVLMHNDRSYCAQAVGRFRKEKIYNYRTTFVGRVNPKYNITAPDGSAGCVVTIDGNFTNSGGIEGVEVWKMFSQFYSNPAMGVCGKASFSNGLNITLDMCEGMQNCSDSSSVPQPTINNYLRTISNKFKPGMLSSGPDPGPDPGLAPSTDPEDDPDDDVGLALSELMTVAMLSGDGQDDGSSNMPPGGLGPLPNLSPPPGPNGPLDNKPASKGLWGATSPGGLGGFGGKWHGERHKLQGFGRPKPPGYPMASPAPYVPSPQAQTSPSMASPSLHSYPPISMTTTPIPQTYSVTTSTFSWHPTPSTPTVHYPNQNH